MTFTDAELAALQAVAEAATPGLWEHNPGKLEGIWHRVPHGEVAYAYAILICADEEYPNGVFFRGGQADMAHIAAFSPATALRLLKEHREMATLLSAALHWREIRTRVITQTAKGEPGDWSALAEAEHSLMKATEVK